MEISYGKNKGNHPKQSFLEEWGVLLVMGLASFILVLDTSMMNVAISAIVEDLNTTVSGVQAAGAAVGPIYGGFMTTFFSWRLAFASEGVIVVIIFALLFVLPESRRWRGLRLIGGARHYG